MMVAAGPVAIDLNRTFQITGWDDWNMFHLLLLDCDYNIQQDCVIEQFIFVILMFLIILFRTIAVPKFTAIVAPPKWG